MTPTSLRPAIEALWAVDRALADVVTDTSDPMLGAIRLAWWRDNLEGLDHSPPPAEARLERVSGQLLPLGVSGAELGRLAECWQFSLNSFPWDEMVAGVVEQRGAILFEAGARILGEPEGLPGAAGAIWSLVDAAQHCSDATSHGSLLARARQLAAALSSQRAPARLRPLTVLGALAAYDATSGFSGSGWSRGIVAVRHRVSGRFPTVG